MQFYGFTIDQLNDIADALPYPAKVYFRHTSTKGRSINGVLRVRDSRAEGARLAASGRHTPSASWEAHRDFMRALFALNPSGRIKTALADYRSSMDFEHSYQSTGSKQVGSMMAPVCFAELSV
jgi:hypothetical protein